MNSWIPLWAFNEVQQRLVQLQKPFFKNIWGFFSLYYNLFKLHCEVEVGMWHNMKGSKILRGKWYLTLINNLFGWTKEKSSSSALNSQQRWPYFCSQVSTETLLSHRPDSSFLFKMLMQEKKHGCKTTPSMYEQWPHDSAWQPCFGSPNWPHTCAATHTQTDVWIRSSGRGQRWEQVFGSAALRVLG